MQSNETDILNILSLNFQQQFSLQRYCQILIEKGNLKFNFAYSIVLHYSFNHKEMSENHNIWSYHNEHEMISALRSLHTFANQYQIEQIGQQILMNMVVNYPKYRAIRGEGNCFYRAVAFLYLRQSDLSNFKKLFADIPMICTNYPIDIQKQSQFKESLVQAYQKFIKPLSRVRNKAQKEIRIQNLFNQYWAFDTLMIAYFRSLNYRQVNQNGQKYSKFYQNKDAQLRKIATFYQQSQGVELHSMADALNVKITIVCAVRKNFSTVQYNSGSSFGNYKLFFRPGHYDVIYSQNQLKTVEKKTQSSNIQKKFANKQYERMVCQDEQSQIQNRNNFNVNSVNSVNSAKSINLGTKSTKDPRVKNNKNQSYTQQSPNRSGERRQSSSIRYQGNSSIDMTGSTKQQTLKHFHATESKRNKNFDYYSDGSLRPNQQIKKISVKNEVVQSEVNVWRIFTESSVVLFILYFGYRLIMLLIM